MSPRCLVILPTYLGRYGHIQKDELVNGDNYPNFRQYTAPQSTKPEKLPFRLGEDTLAKDLPLLSTNVEPSSKLNSTPLCSAHYHVRVSHTGIIPSHVIHKRALHCDDPNRKRF